MHIYLVQKCRTFAIEIEKIIVLLKFEEIMAYFTALELIKVEGNNESVVCRTEDVGFDHQKLRALYFFRELYDGYMDYFLEVSKKQLPEVYKKTKSSWADKSSDEALEAIISRTDYDYIRINIYEFDYGME